MSNTKREPLLSDEDINDPKLVIPLGAKMIRDIYEADRAKDAELIQRLVDALHDSWPSHHEDAHTAYYAAVEAAEAAGFKPSDR
jgi:hypothetical protein